MKTARVTQVVEVKPWTGANGTVQYCKCQMDNGDKIEIGKKKAVEVGWELTYEITDTQFEYQKARAVTPEQTPQVQQKSSTNDSILYQVCLKGAMDYYIQNHGVSGMSPQEINSLAFEIAQIAKQNIAKL